MVVGHHKAVGGDDEARAQRPHLIGCRAVPVALRLMLEEAAKIFLEGRTGGKARPLEFMALAAHPLAHRGDVDDRRFNPGRQIGKGGRRRRRNCLGWIDFRDGPRRRGDENSSQDKGCESASSA